MAMSVEHRPKSRAFQRGMVTSPYHLIEKISIWDEKPQTNQKANIHSISVYAYGNPLFHQPDLGISEGNPVCSSNA